MGIGLYIHVPFCVVKCRYCAFTSYPVDKEDTFIYIDALSGEMEARSVMLSPEDREVDTVYIGGGTPTCLSAKDLEVVFKGIYSNFDISAGAEVTVEANPGTVDGHKLSFLRECGVNRISMGIQSCQKDNLGVLGRIHTFEDAVSTFNQAREAGFDNLSVDLMFGIPGQSFEQWKECLDRVTDLKPDHISAYGLQLEEGTPLFEGAREGRVIPCPEDLEADMYKYLKDFLESRGYIHYEISNFALSGRLCRHNLIYWHNRQYLGLGPAAHSFMAGRRFSNYADLRSYAARLRDGALPQCWEEVMDCENEMSETVFMGLRLVEGLDMDQFRKRFGKDIKEVYGARIQRLEGLGLIESDSCRVRLTEKGLLLGNMVFMEFVG